MRYIVNAITFLNMHVTVYYGRKSAWLWLREYIAQHTSLLLMLFGIGSRIPNGNNDLTLHWPHIDHGGVSNHQPHGCLLNRLFRRRSKKTSKLRVTGLHAGNSPGTGEFPAQMASDAENVSIWWRHHDPLIIYWIDSNCNSGDWIILPSYWNGHLSQISENGGPIYKHYLSEIKVLMRLFHILSDTYDWSRFHLEMII